MLSCCVISNRQYVYLQHAVSRVHTAGCYSQSSPEEWREITQRNQDRAEEQRCESIRLRHLIDRILQEVSHPALQRQSSLIPSVSH